MQVTLARNAMATRFELVLQGEDPVALRAAGEEALDEIDRLEARLSLFRPSSEIAHLNARAARVPVRVTPAVFSLLERARQLSRETGGAFDITVAPLVRCWGFLGSEGRVPTSEELDDALEKVGMDLVVGVAGESTIFFTRPGVMLDLGAIGKGYAIEHAAEVLRDAGVTSALLHGGTSTVYALGSPPQSERWEVAIEHPLADVGAPGSPATGVSHGFALTMPAPAGSQQLPFATVGLKDEALSVSAVWGKAFEQEGKLLGHVIDPRTGQPASAALLAAVALPSATETDALSTALLTLGLEGHDRIANLRPQMRTLVAAERGGTLEVRSRGILPQGR